MSKDSKMRKASVEESLIFKSFSLPSFLFSILASSSCNLLACSVSLEALWLFIMTKLSEKNR
jgi:hypothetical protein